MGLENIAEGQVDVCQLQADLTYFICFIFALVSPTGSQLPIALVMIPVKTALKKYTWTLLCDTVKDRYITWHPLTGQGFFV